MYLQGKLPVISYIVGRFGLLVALILNARRRALIDALIDGGLLLIDCCRSSLV